MKDFHEPLIMRKLVRYSCINLNNGGLNIITQLWGRRRNCIDTWAYKDGYL